MRGLAFWLVLVWAGIAAAQPSDAPETRGPASNVPASAPASGPTSAPAAPLPGAEIEGPAAFSDAVKLRFFEQARKRKAELERQQAELSRRVNRLEKLQTDVEGRYRALRLIQDEIAASGSKTDDTPPEVKAAQQAKEQQTREENTRRLSKMFEKMKPDEAARVVPEMDPDLVVAVLLQIKDRQAARILGSIQPGLAARLSEKMALLRKQRGEAPKP